MTLIVSEYGPNVMVEVLLLPDRLAVMVPADVVAFAATVAVPVLKPLIVRADDWVALYTMAVPDAFTNLTVKLTPLLLAIPVKVQA